MSGTTRTGMGLNAAVSVIGAAAILVMINYLSMRHYVRGDWTAAGLYTLSDKSEKVVRALPRDVQIFAMWSQADPRFADVKELLDDYAGHSRRVTWEVVDPDLARDRAQLLIQRYGGKVLTDGVNTGYETGLFVVSGDNVKFLAAGEFEDVAMADPFGAERDPGEHVTGYLAEQKITAALLRVTSEKQTKICFVQGHGEWSLEGFGGRSLGHVRDELVQDSFRVEAIATAGASRIPEGCELVVCAGPRRAPMEEELALLERYLEDGGRVLLLLDPIIDGERFAPTGFERLAADHGIRLGVDLLIEVDPRRLVSPAAETFLASEFTGHQAVRQLAVPDSVDPSVRESIGAFPVVFSSVRSLAAAEGAGVFAEPLARTSPASWGETDLSFIGDLSRPPAKDERDTPGPAVISMAAALPDGPGGQPGGRLVVVGDSDFLGEELYAHASFYNRDFWSGLVGWLTAREDLISIAPKNPEHVRLTLTGDDFLTISLLLLGELLLGVGLGIAVWIRRRS
jgi:hypothetical protein